MANQTPFDLNDFRFFGKILKISGIYWRAFQMKMPTTILCIILTAVSLTSANATITNQSGLKISSISLRPLSSPQEDMNVDIHLWGIESDDAPSAYFENCGMLVQAVEYRP
jgi:hypothetical protein